MKAMREALEVANAKKAEYEIKLSTVREQCRQEMRREMDEEVRRVKRDLQRQLDEKNRSLEEIKSEKESLEKTVAAEKVETAKTDSSASVRLEREPHTFCASRDIRVSYGWCLRIQEFFLRGLKLRGESRT